GIPSTNNNAVGFLGFASNKSNPCATVGPRIDPFFEFKANRINTQVLDELQKANFYTYVDPYGKTPDLQDTGGKSSFAYFSTYKVRNGYQTIDCQRLGVQPYSDGVNYLNPDTFQIISAGRDQKFGPGGTWTPLTAISMPPAGRDDLSNFYEVSL